MDKILRNIYYDKSSPAGYASAEKLYKEAKKHTKVTLKDVKKFLEGQLTFSLHKNARRKWLRKRVMIDHVDECMQADLVDLQMYSKDNDSYKYILTAIDLLSKFAFAIPIKSKTNTGVKGALKKIFEQRKPSRFQTDQGLEFASKEMKRFYKEYEIKYYTAKNEDTKAQTVERFNRTLKAKMFKIFTAQGNRRYIDFLDEIVKTYNSTVHRSTGMQPRLVTHENEHIVFKKLYGYKNKREFLIANMKEPKDNKEGDTVRLKYKMGPFDKGYFPNWTDKTYKIKRRTAGGLFHLEGQKRRYYDKEIQKIDSDPLYRIDQLIKVRMKKGKEEYYVSWLNYPPEYNSWIDAKALENVE